MTTYQQASSLQKQMIEDRRQLHRIPELGMKLPHTVDFVKKRLAAMGYKPVDVCESGITASLGNGPGKVLLLRADMDALPVAEASGEAFAAGNGNMHACGHDLHTAILLGVAQLLKQREREIPGTVKLMFQPGEEVFGGAEAMISGGILENPKVDAALALHVASQILACGEIYLRPGPTMASCNGFHITITGKGAHGAMPETGVDPILIGSHIVQNLQAIPSRETGLTNGALVTIGAFNAGNAPNVIPHTARLQGTMRTFNEAIREETLKRIHDIVQSTAQMFRGRCDLELSPGVPCLVNDPDLTGKLKQYMGEMPGLPVKVSPGPQMAWSEDFACIANKVPAVLFWLGAKTRDNNRVYPQHHPQAVFNEDCMPIGAAILAEAAIRWLEENR